MAKSIRLSKKHGVNPTIPTCFWCGEKKNEIALLGKLKGDIEAPMSMWIPGDYEPCEKCAEFAKQGIRIIEAYEEPKLNENQPPYYGAYPTGRFVVIKESAICKAPLICENEEDLEQIIKTRMCFIDHEGFEKLIEIKNRDENKPLNEG